MEWKEGYEVAIVKKVNNVYPVELKVKLSHQEHVEPLDGVGMTATAVRRKGNKAATGSPGIHESGGISTEWRKRDGDY